MTATCTDPQYNWMFNHLGQSPCEIAYALSNACNSGSAVNPWQLVTSDSNPNPQYPVLPAENANPCTCSTVWYGLIVACSACQSRSYLGFKALSQNCGKTYIEQFPRPIPDGTAVPHFAYVPLYQGDLFNWNAVPNYDIGIPDSTPVPAATSSKPQTSPASSAQVSQSSPQSQTTTVINQNSATITGLNGASSSGESTKITVSTIAANGTTTIITYNGGVQTLPTSSGSHSSSGSPQATSGTGTSQSEATTASKGSSKTGAIIGGVIGALVLACLCAVLVFILWRRRRGQRAGVEQEEARLRPSPLMAQYNDDDGAEPPPYMISDDATTGSTNPPQSANGSATKSAQRAVTSSEPPEGAGGNQPLHKSRVDPSDHSRTASESRSGSEYV